MRKIIAILILVSGTTFADPLDCSVIKTCDQNGKCSEELWIMAKCTKNPFEVFQNFLKMNMPEKTIYDFVIVQDENGTRFIPVKH